MPVKITTAAQTGQLHAGNVLLKYPTDGDPEDRFNELRRDRTEAYEIRFINLLTGMIELVMTTGSRIRFASPADVGRQFIRPANLITERIWWLS